MNNVEKPWFLAENNELSSLPTVQKKAKWAFCKIIFHGSERASGGEINFIVLRIRLWNRALPNLIKKNMNSCGLKILLSSTHV